MDLFDLKKTSPFTITAESILDKISQDYLKCSICLNTFTEPTFLDCHHTFCQSCLNDLRRSECYNSQRGIHNVTCPSCRKVTSLSGRGIADLQQNFTLKSLADDITQQQKLLRVQQGALICGQCADESIAVIQCTDCDMKFCQDCWFDHEPSHLNHEIDVLNQTSNEKAPKCPKHKDLDCCMYCLSCKVLLCAMCAATTHRGMDHKHTDIEEAINSLKEELWDLISQADKRVESFIQEKSLAEYKMEEADTEYIQIETEIKDVKCMRLHDPTAGVHQLHVVVLKMKLDHQCKTKVKLSEILIEINAKVEWATHILERIKDQMKEPSKFKLLQMSEVLEVRIDDIINKQFLEIVYPCPFLK